LSSVLLKQKFRQQNSVLGLDKLGFSWYTVYSRQTQVHEAGDWIMALITHADKIKTWSLDTPFAKDEESDYCEWCGEEATHWTQLERGEQPRSRSFFHCEAHRLNAQMVCVSDTKYTSKEIAISNQEKTVVVTYRTVLNGLPVATEEITVNGEHLGQQIAQRAQVRQTELAYDNNCSISYTVS